MLLFKKMYQIKGKEKVSFCDHFIKFVNFFIHTPMACNDKMVVLCFPTPFFGSLELFSSSSCWSSFSSLASVMFSSHLTASSSTTICFLSIIQIMRFWALCCYHNWEQQLGVQICSNHPIFTPSPVFRLTNSRHQYSSLLTLFMEI